MDTTVQHGDRSVAAALGLLGASNVIANRVLPDGGYVPWNLGVTAGLAWLARRAGIGWAALGLDRRHLASGVVTGASAAGVVVSVYALGLARGDTGALHDRRVTELAPPEAWFQALVRIPLGTVVLEEFAFRAALPALVRASRLPDWAAPVGSSVAFGLWHILPSQELVAANDGAGHLSGRLGPGRTTALSVATTAATGGLLTALGRRGRHLAAPFLAHWASNAVGLGAARWAARLTRTS